VLATDWGKPGSGLTANIEDRRAIHYWDPSRRLSALYGGPARVESLAAAREVAFKMKDVIWDAAFVYPPGVKWGERADLLVAPVFKFPQDIGIHLSQIDQTVSTVAWVMDDVSSLRRSSQARP
jgi:hypothetical protein